MTNIYEHIGRRSFSEKVTMSMDDADHQWPVTKKAQQLQLDKFEPTDMASVKAMIEKTEEKIQKENQARAVIAKKLTERKWDREYLIPTVRSRRYRRRYCYGFTSDVMITRKEIELLQKALRSRTASQQQNERGQTDEQAYIKSLCHSMHHGCNNLVDERRILKEIQHAEEKPISQSDMKSKIQHEWKYLGLGKVTDGSRQVLKKRLKLAFQELQMLTMENKAVRAEEEQLKKELEAARNDVRLFRRQLDEINRRKAKLYGYILEIRKQIEKGL